MKEPKVSFLYKTNQEIFGILWKSIMTLYICLKNMYLNTISCFCDFIKNYILKITV